jgi:phage tail sheath gpL-like
MERPLITTTFSASPGSASVGERKLLFVGQQLSTGTATAGELTENIVSRKQAKELFGAKSMLYQGIRKYFDLIDFTGTIEKPSLNVIPLADDGSATKASSALIFTGTATEVADYTISINQYTYTVSVALGDDPEQIMGKFKALLDADLEVPVTYTVSTTTTTDDTITFESANGGSVGNSTQLKIDGSVAGITYTIGGASVSKAFFTGGATNPSLTSLFDAIEGKRFTSFIYPNEYTNTDLLTLLRLRAKYNNKVLEGYAVITKDDTYANIQGTNNFSNEHLVYTTFKKGSRQATSYEVSSQLASLLELYLTEGAIVSNLAFSVVTSGGIQNAVVPYHNSILPTIDVEVDGFTQEENQQLGSEAFTLIVNNNNNTYPQLDIVYTTRTENLNGNPDSSLLEFNDRMGMYVCGEYIFNNLKADRDLSKATLTSGSIVNKTQINKEAILAKYNTYLEFLSNTAGIIDNGRLKELKGLVAANTELNFEERSISSEISVILVGQLRKIALNIVKRPNA